MTQQPCDGFQMADPGQDVVINLQVQAGIDTDTRMWVVAERRWIINGTGS